MYRIVKYSEDERRILFRNTSQKMNIHEAIIEKDFWVCLILDYLFHKCEYSKVFTFKGGTSLSKCYGLIHRFSEDIDLILDWRTLGYTINEPWKERSSTKQDAFNKEVNHRAEDFLRDTLLPILKKDITEIMGEEAQLYIDEIDPQTICFSYPHIFQTESILQVIRLEIGALAAWTPAKEVLIEPYAAKYYPKAFEQKETIVLTAAASRTFWEKITILHHEANRPEILPMPERYSRHYYDLYCIARSENKRQSFADIDLLRRVVQFKMKFYPRKWAQYNEAVLGTMKLVPPDYRLDALRKDYENMSEMIFGEYPSFEELMSYISELETEINHL
ncbi:MAG: nucleotidyl transferase AbiEii/AbiGii toxin family protein [Lachnospiraceae bacterium]|nr:nucleotidyl transferase AbiEii/AbiGii toxin family protein [Lachnospiraceae bacterium]